MNKFDKSACSRLRLEIVLNNSSEVFVLDDVNARYFNAMHERHSNVKRLLALMIRCAYDNL